MSHGFHDPPHELIVDRFLSFIVSFVCVALCFERICAGFSPDERVFDSFCRYASV